MITLTFPDSAVRQVKAGLSGGELAASISKSLEKKAVALMKDGVLPDLADPIARDAKVRIITRDDAEALELIRHDCAHVLAEAVQELYPGTQVTIGPVIENGFYYDFFRNQPFTPEDFEAIENKMREIIARDRPFTKEVWSRDEAKRVFGMVGGAAIAGAIFSGLLAKTMAKRFGTESLLLAMTLFVLICAGLIIAVWRSGRASVGDAQEAPGGSADTTERNPLASMRLLFSSPYLRAIAAVICIGSLVTTLTDWQFLAIGQQVLVKKDVMAIFFGNFNFIHSRSDYCFSCC